MTHATYRVLVGDALEQLRTLPDGSVQTCITSPPYYGLRDYGAEGQIGVEPTPAEYVAKLVAVFREVKRVLREDGTLWLNLGDSYAGSWGAQSRPNGNDIATTIQGGSMLHARQIQAHPKGQTHTGSLKNTPGLKPKDLMGIPWRVAFALQEDGWYLRSEIIWSKPAPMPESVKDRPTRSHEQVFLLSKQPRYYYDADAIREPYAEDSVERVVRGRSNRHKWVDGGPGSQTLAADISKACSSPLGRNKRDVWSVNTAGFPGAHFATFPEALVEPMILAGCPEGGTVLDPFAGSGTTLAVANRLGRHAIGIELNPDYLPLIEKRCQQGSFVFAEG